MKTKHLLLLLLFVALMPWTAVAQKTHIASTSTSTTMTWAEFASNISNGNTYSGATIYLDEDITTSTMAGNSTYKFKGTFDGQGHTLTFNCTTSAWYTAPFQYLDGATIRNLKTDGTITTSSARCGGLAGHCYGTTNIVNCLSNVTINSSYNGVGQLAGFVAVVRSGTTTLESCAFTGKLLGTKATQNGGMVAWGVNDGTTSATVVFRNCLFAPQQITVSTTNSYTFARADHVTVTNSYYTRTLGTAQGKLRYTLSAESPVTMELNGTLTNNDVSLITTCSGSPGFGYDGYIIAASGEQLSLNLSGGDDYIVDHGSLTGTSNPYTFTMVAYNTTISAVPSRIVNTVTDATQMTWAQFATNVNNGTTYSGKTIYLDEDITATTMVGTNETNCFKGTFDGQGHSITFNYSNTSEDWCAPFHYLNGATIRNLTINGTITANYDRCGGLAGDCYGTNTIVNCLSNITINSTVNGDGTHGGFISRINGGSTTIEGCTFTGSLLGENTNSIGGFVGWTDFADHMASVSFSNCIYAPTANTTDLFDGATFSRAYYSATSGVSISNCFYTSSEFQYTQGKKIYTVTAENPITATLDGTPTNYDVSHITAYSDNVGLLYDNTIIAGSGDQLSLDLNDGLGIYSVDHGTLTGTSNPYTLTMEAYNTTISSSIELTVVAYCTSASLSWGAYSAATAWEICLNGDESNLITTTDNHYLLTDLAPLSSYIAKMRACFGSDRSAWSNTVIFSTVEGITTFPYRESFEGVSAGIFEFNPPVRALPPGWSAINTNTMLNPMMPTVINFSGYINYQYYVATRSNSLAFNMDTHENNYMYAILPPMNTEGKQIMFLAAGTGDLTVGLMTDPNDPATFVACSPTYSLEDEGYYGYSQFFLDQRQIVHCQLEGEGDYIAIRYKWNASGNFACIDNVSVEDLDPISLTDSIFINPTSTTHPSICSYLPFANNNFYNNSYYSGTKTQQIYTPDELGEAGEITHIGFLKSTENQLGSRPLNIYMVNTDKQAFDNENDIIPYSSYDLVFSGTVDFDEGVGWWWYNIPLDAPFHYTGQHNVCIIVESIASAGAESNFHALNTTLNQSIVFFIRGNNYTPGYFNKEKNNLLIAKAPALDITDELTVSNVTTTTADLSWQGPAGAESYTVRACIKIGTYQSDWQTLTSTTESLHLTNLIPTMEYMVQVKSNLPSDEWSRPIGFNTPPTEEVMFSFDFETSSGYWTFVNGDLPNIWCWGNATNNGLCGHKALYISNDGGTTNAYTANHNNTVYAYRTMSLNTDYLYTFTYDWKAQGEGVNDYLRVALVPDSVNLEASTTVPDGLSYNTLPEGWIALDGGSGLNGATEWQTESQTIIIPALGNYKLVFIWRNNDSFGYDPPAAFDNVRIERYRGCRAPFHLAANGFTQHDAEVSWDGSMGVDNYTMKYRPVSATEWQTVSVPRPSGSATVNTTLTDLIAETEYELWVYPDCNPNWWIGTTFNTLDACTVPSDFVADNITQHSVDLSWIGSLEVEHYVVEYRTLPTGEWQADTVPGNATQMQVNATLADLQVESSYEVRIYPECDPSLVSDTITFNTLELCLTPVDFAVSNINNTHADLSWIGSMDLEYTVEYQGIHNNVFTEGFENGLGDWTLRDCSAAQLWLTQAHSGNLSFRFYNLSNQTELLISPELTGITEEMNLSFYTKLDGYNNNVPVIDNAFQIGFSSTDNATESFTFGDTIVATNMQWQATHVTIPAGTKYICWKHSPECFFRLLIDDIAIGTMGAWQTISVAEGTEQVSTTLTGLTPETMYRVQTYPTYCGPEKMSELLTFNTFETCHIPTDFAASQVTHNAATLSWTDSQEIESYTVKYKMVDEILDTIFTEGFENGIGNWTLRDCHTNTGIYGSLSAYSGYRGFRFRYSSNPPQYLISPELTGNAESMNLVFYYKNESASWPETFQVGFSATDNETESFTFGETITAADVQWHLYSESIPAGTKYICWKYTSNDKLALYIDDIIVYAGIPWQTVTVAGGSEQVGVTLTDLTPETEYEALVYPNCAPDKESDTLRFTTTEAPSTVVQTLNLSAGVNWVSFYVETTLDDLKTALEGTDNTSITIAYLNQNTKYISGRWRGNLTFDLSRMYKITVDNACEIELEGLPIDPTAHPITITPGANWIGYPLDATMTPTDAFAGFAINGDGISYANNNAKYTGGRWRGNCDLVGGHGYIYNSAASENRTLVFPAPSKARKMKP